MVSRVVTIPQVGWAEPQGVCAEPPTRAPTRLDHFIVGPENALVRVVLDGLIERCSCFGQARPSDTTAIPRLNLDVRADVESGNAVESHGATDEGFSIYHPLLLCGPTGSGKSFWVHTLLRAWQTLRPADAIVLTTGADFARDFVEAIDRRQVVAWRERMRGAALVVVDELSQLAERQAAQVELANMLDELGNRGGLAILLSRVSLARCREFLSPQLMGRLVGGATVELRWPELDARREILRRFAEQRRLTLASGVLRVLSEGLRGNVPELFSALMTLESRVVGQGSRYAAGSISHSVKEIDLATARQYVLDVQEAKTPSLGAIATHAARHFTLTAAELKSASRRQAIVQARNVAMYLARQLTAKSFDEIGRFFGGRDHTTVLHGCRMAEKWIKSDLFTRQTVEQIQAALQPS